MSIATEISRLTSAKASIKSAIEAKGVTVPSSTTLDGYATLISSIPSGGTDFNAWVKNGDTHLWIEIVDSAQLAQTIRIRMIGTINWGDGGISNANVTTYTNFTHTYAQTGRYRIDLHPTSGTFYLGGGSSSYCVMGSATAKYRHRVVSLYQVEIGSSRITTISAYAFYVCHGLVKVYVPQTITTINSYAFNSCFSLQTIEFQDVSKLTTASASNVFCYCYCLRGLVYPSTDATVSAYRACRSLVEITLPSGVTNLAQNALNGTYSLQKLKCLPTTPPTVANANAFTDMNADCVIEVPAASLATYQAADKWSARASQMVGV